MEKLTDIEKKQMKDFITEQGFAGRQTVGVWKKQLVAVVAVVMIGILAFGFTFPAWGQYLPFVGRIFEVFEHPHGAIIEFDHLQEFVTEVNLSGSIGNAEVTIQDIVFDGKKLYFTYTIESSRRSIRNTQIDIRNLRLFVDGEDVQADKGWGLRPGSLLKVSENEYISIAVIYFSNFLGVIDNGEVYFDVELTRGSDEIWSVSFPIERVDVAHTVLNETFASDGFEMTITSILNAPSGILMHFLYEMPVGYGLDFDVYDNATVIFRILDDLGNEIEAVGSGEGELGRDIVTRHAGWLDFTDLMTPSTENGYGSAQIHPEASQLTIIPYVLIHDGAYVGIREVILGEIVIELL